MEKQDSVLLEIDEVKKRREAVEAARNAVRSKASTMLMEGMGSQSQQEVTNALLAFAALGTLRDKVRTAVSISSNRARRVVDAGLTEVSQEDAWGAVEATAGELHELCLGVWHLQHVLVRCRDPTTGCSLWETASLPQSIVEPFWVQLAAKFSGALALPARRVLHHDYPRLYRLLTDFCRKSMHSYEMLQLQAPHRVTEEAALSFLLRPLTSVAQAHLSRCKKRFQNVAQSIIPPSQGPSGGVAAPPRISDSKIVAFCRTVTKELVDARDAPPVLQAVTEEVLETMEKIASGFRKRMVRNVTELSIATQTPAHQGNASFYNTMLAIAGSLRSVMFSLGKDFQHPLLLKAVEVCENVERDICEPLAGAVKMNLSAAHVFRSSVLPLYHASRIVEDSLETLVVSVAAEDFLQRATKKPLSQEAERAALVKQCSSLEERLSHLSSRGDSVRLLVAFRSVLELNDAGVEEGEVSDSLVQELKLLGDVRAMHAVARRGGYESEDVEALMKDPAQLEAHPYEKLLLALQE